MRVYCIGGGLAIICIFFVFNFFVSFIGEQFFARERRVPPIVTGAIFTSALDGAFRCFRSSFLFTDTVDRSYPRPPDQGSARTVWCIDDISSVASIFRSRARSKFTFRTTDVGDKVEHYRFPYTFSRTMYTLSVYITVKQACIVIIMNYTLRRAPHSRYVSFQFRVQYTWQRYY